MSLEMVVSLGGRNKLRLLRQASPQQFLQLRGRDPHSYIKMAEQCVYGADFIEAHFVDQLLKNQRLVGEKVDAPFPIVKTNRSADDLFHFSGVAAADESMI